ncbi:MAG: TonB-dependent receptor [Pseudomonadota bacterium]
MSSIAMANDNGMLITAVNEAKRPVSETLITIEGRDGSRVSYTTDQSGTVVAQGLQPGFYRVQATQSAYQGVVEPSVRVVRGKLVLVKFVMRPKKSQIVEEVLVVADAIRSDAFGSVANTYIDRDQLRSAAGSGGDVLRALDGLPGLFSTGEFASFTVRGRGPRDNLILVDGFPYDKVVHFDSSLGETEDINGGGRFSIFAPNLIEGVEYSPGGWRSAFGGRNGSMLNLDVAQGNPSPTASLRLDLAGAEFIYDGPSGLNDQTSVLFSARNFDFGRLFDTLGEDDNGSATLTDVILKTHTDLDLNNEVELILLHTPETRERTVENVLASENLEDRELLDNKQDSTLLGLTWTRRFAQDGSWTNRVFYRDTEKTSAEGEAFPNSTPMDMPEALVPIREDILTLEENEREFGWRSDLSLTNRFGLFSAGLRVSSLDLEFSTTLADDWIRYEYDGRDSTPDQTARYVILTPENINSAYAQKETQYAAYIEQVLERDDWSVRLGLRYEQDGFSDQSYVSPRLAATYQLSPATSLSATAGTYYQPPRFLDRAADTSNFTLENERLDHVSIGLERRVGSDWSFLIEAYYQELSDLVTESDQATGLVSNRGEGTSYGVDFVLNRYFRNGWSANAVYSYNDATLDDRDGEGEYAADYNYEHLFSVGARWEINERWQVGLRWKYATGRPRDEFVVHDDVLADISGPLRFSREYITNNTERWDDFHTLNLRVDYRRSFGSLDVVAYLDVLNLYGSSATDELEFEPATGELIEDDGDILPLIGIRFERVW